MRHREGDREGHREEGTQLWSKGKVVERGAGKGNVVIEQREGIREGNKAVGILLWGIGRSVGRGTRQWDCGFGA